MKKVFRLAALAMLATWMVACNSDDAENINAEPQVKIKATATQDNTLKLGYSENTQSDGVANSLHTVWKNPDNGTDGFSVLIGMSDSQQPNAFSLTGGEGTKIGMFDGTVPSSTAVGSPMYAIYPALDAHSTYSPTDIVFSLANQGAYQQVADLANNPYHLMVATAQYQGAEADYNFSFQHKVAVVKLMLTLPSGADGISSIKIEGPSINSNATVNLANGNLSKQSGSITASGNFVLGASHTLTAYMFMFADDIKDATITVEGDKASYTLTDPLSAATKVLEAGKVYTVKRKAADFTETLTFGLAKKEFRAAWLTTITGEWPISRGDSPEKMKADLVKILDSLQANNYNALIFQVRPYGDALYASNYEPWSHVLTGTQGQNPGWDPLAFAVAEAHKRGIQLHAWLNPYRLAAVVSVPTLAEDSPATENPSWMVTYTQSGKDYRYYNPGVPEVRTLLLNVIKDIITRYDVDGIQFDDYFYPAGVKNGLIAFDDDDAYATYGNGLLRSAWRAQNVSTMVREVYETIKATRSDVIMGISPAGVYDNSVALYANPLEWLNNKWVDYLAPQVYWKFSHASAAFDKQVDYWAGKANGVSLFIGMAAYQNWTDADEYTNQVLYTRNKAEVSGCLQYKATSVFGTTNPANQIRALFKPYKSLPPVIGAHTAAILVAPSLSVNGTTLSWSAVPGADKYVVYVVEKDIASNQFVGNAVAITDNTTTEYVAESGKFYVVTAANAFNMESGKSNLQKAL